MYIDIRQETSADIDAVDQVIQAAFRDEPVSDQSEHLLVRRLRKSPAFIPELSLVAECDGRVVGHILLTKAGIKNGGDSYEVLSLAPVSVHPSYQRKGIGSQLIKKAHHIARELGYRAVVLIGHEDYYPRFGYEPSVKYGIAFPFEAPEINCMVLDLKGEGLKDVYGNVEYPRAFYQ